jgi:hypothetical protein
MENEFAHDLGPVTVRWVRTRMGGDLLDIWHAYIEAPARSEHFAYVSKDIHGRWFASLSPRGYKDKRSLYARFASPDRAVNQVERWARVHWSKIPEWHDPMTWGVR